MKQTQCFAVLTKYAERNEVLQDRSAGKARLSWRLWSHDIHPANLPPLFLSVNENSRAPPLITEPKNMGTSYGKQETPHSPAYYG
jgi:hypothetical protein